MDTPRKRQRPLQEVLEMRIEGNSLGAHRPVAKILPNRFVLRLKQLRAVLYTRLYGPAPNNA